MCFIHVNLSFSVWDIRYYLMLQVGDNTHNHFHFHFKTCDRIKKMHKSLFLSWDYLHFIVAVAVSNKQIWQYCQMKRFIQYTVIMCFSIVVYEMYNYFCLSLSHTLTHTLVDPTSSGLISVSLTVAACYVNRGIQVSLSVIHRWR